MVFFWIVFISDKTRHARLIIRVRSHLVTGTGARVRYLLGTNVNTRFFQVPTPESGHGRVPEYKVKTLYSGTYVGTGSLCARVFPWFQGTFTHNPLLYIPITPCYSHLQTWRWLVTSEVDERRNNRAYRCLQWCQNVCKPNDNQQRSLQINSGSLEAK